MIDLHIHLLPNVDDGPQSLEISESMLELAAPLGFNQMVATPHLHGQLTTEYRERVEAALEEIRPAAARNGIEVGSGYEIDLAPDTATRLERGEPLTLAGSSAVLVELPFSAWPMHADSSLFALQTLGYRVILAHPERYSVLQQDLDKALGLVDRGIMLQVTFGSFVGLFGKPAQRVAEELLRNDAITILASDAHSAGQRFVTIDRGHERAIELAGAARVQQLTTDNPAALLASEPLPAAVSLELAPKRGGLLARLKRE